MKKILAIDGKTQCGTKTKNQKANHTIIAVGDKGFCLNQIKVDDKSNEITAVPKLLETLNIRGYIVTTDTMDCQKEIARKIRQKRGDYVLALKNNHPDFCDDVKTYFEDKEL